MLRVFGAAGLTTSVQSAPPGTRTTLTGSGFAPQETVKIYFGSLASAPLTVTADSSGAFTEAVRVPPAPYGPHDVYAVGESSGRAGAVSLFVTPRMALVPHSGNPGGTELAQGLGFAADESVQVYWANPRQFLGTALTNGSGSFIGKGGLQIAIPANAPPGRNAVIATGDTSSAVAIGEVIVH